MNRLGTAGGLWIVAAGFAIAMTLIFRTDPFQWVVTVAVGVVAIGAAAGVAAYRAAARATLRGTIS